MGLERLPHVPWPTPPPKANPPATPQINPPEPSQPVVNSRRALGGLVWPEEGHPGFICVLSELPMDISRTFEVSLPSLEVAAEMSMASLSGLPAVLAALKTLRCAHLYTDLDKKNYAFIRDFNRDRRESGSFVQLKQTRSSSLESALIKIKDTIGGKRLKFPPVSVVRSQLSSFSKADLKHDVPFFAVRALSMVIDAFKSSEPVSAVVEVPRLSSWY